MQFSKACQGGFETQDNLVIGLSFERPYLMRGLNLMQPKSLVFWRKPRILAQKLWILVKTTDFGENVFL